MDWLQNPGTALLVVLSGIITWFAKSKIEELRVINEKLRKERRNIYAQILDPYIRLFADIKGKGPDEALKMVTSYNYKKNAFDLNLIGSDKVVFAFNNLMTHSYKAEATGNKDPKEMMSLWGELLLEMRKSLGNKNTKLNKYDMLKAMVKDIDKLEHE